jgi:predicted small secreted protein
MIDLPAEPSVRQWSPAAQFTLILPIEGVDFKQEHLHQKNLIIMRMLGNNIKSADDKQMTRCEMKRRINLGCICLIIAAFSLSGCATTVGASGQNQPLEFETFLLNGLHPSGVPVGWQVMRNEGEWENFWSQHSFKPAPEIDFNKYTLIMVFLGRKPNPGYSIKITDVREYRDKVVVKAVETEPQPDALYAQVIVYPYDAILVPKTDKPIEFEVTKEDDQL